MSLTFENPKDPQDRAFYTVDWSDRITTDDQITRHTVRVVTGAVPELDLDTDLEILASGVIDQAVVAMIVGGTAGKTYRVEFEIETESGQRFNLESKLKVKNL